MRGLLARMPQRLREVFESAALAQYILLVSLVLVLANPLWRAFVGEVGYTILLWLLGLIAALSATARRSAIDWTNAVPLSVLMLLVWAVASLAWSYQPLTTLWRLANLLGVGMLGLYIAWARDTIQIVRGLGNVMRAILSASLVLELVLATLGANWPQLNISGTLFAGGPIQGIVGSRGAMGFLALIALITFGIEWRTRSLPTWLGLTSTALALSCIALASSPITFVAMGVVLSATAVLWLLRRTSAKARWRLHITFATLVASVVALTWLFRRPLVALLDGRAEMTLRVEVWQQMSLYLFNNPLQGWGFSGGWWVGGPYSWVQRATDKTLGSGMNAYIDMYFQLGVIGLLLFLFLLGTALVRSWMLAANRRSAIYVWPALVMVTLVVVSVADSFVLSGAGWMLLLIAVVKSAREMTWRDALTTRSGTSLPSRVGR